MTRESYAPLAVCGKGGVGKTALCALLARVLLDAGVEPLLLVDADPMGGLVSALGEHDIETLAGVRDRLVREARTTPKEDRAQLAEQLDYLLLQAMVERDRYALVAMGHTTEPGCFCQANRLMRDALDTIAEGFRVVLIDGEAGIEQINRRVTRRVGHVVVVTDGSRRSEDTVRAIADLVGEARVSIVANRVEEGWGSESESARQIGVIPADDVLKQFDREGRPLWDLPSECRAVVAARQVAIGLGLVE